MKRSLLDLHSWQLHKRLHTLARLWHMWEFSNNLARKELVKIHLEFCTSTDPAAAICNLKSNGALNTDIVES